MKPSLPSGTRDYLPKEIELRDYIFSTIAKHYQLFGFSKIETPALENLSVLNNKYGDEGDKLLFRILNSGDYLSKLSDEELATKDLKTITPKISDRGLRYDLTVPLARYVVMNRNELEFPFKRYHIDRVWRADRPQKGRYREFYQCDADVIGSDNMIYDADCIVLFDRVLKDLGFLNFTIHFSNRKILSGLAEEGGFANRFQDFAIAIDKLDKIGEQGVIAELGSKSFAESEIHYIQNIIKIDGDVSEVIAQLEKLLETNQLGIKGLAELKEVVQLVQNQLSEGVTLKINPMLARGLDYYTSSIFEVTIDDAQMGSVASGGRYDNLTESFGVKDMPGVGISFGADRLYDLIKAKQENTINYKNAILVANFGSHLSADAFATTQMIRNMGIYSEYYPSNSKLAKQFTYAEKKGIRYLLMLGDDEVKNGIFTIKNIETGDQTSYHQDTFINFLQNL